MIRELGRLVVSLVHLLGAALALAGVSLGVLDLGLVGWAIWNYEPGISIAAILCMAGFGVVVLYLSARMCLLVRDSFRDARQRWQAERDRPYARLVSR